MKKPHQGKRKSHRQPAPPVAASAVPRNPAPASRRPRETSPNPPASDITPVIAFLLGLKASPQPARSPRARTANRAAAIAAPGNFSQDDRATLALLTLPILLMIGSLTITQSLKPIRRTDLAAVPATVIVPPSLAPNPIQARKPQLAPSVTPPLPLSPSAVTTATGPRVPDLAAATPAELPARASSPILSPPSPAISAANDRTAMLTARPPVQLDANLPASLMPPLASQDATLDIEPKVCTARPAPPETILAPAALTPATFGLALASAARAQTHDLVIYSDKYRALSYPRGDVQPLYGVCTDVIIRAYRALGIDLQQLVHESRVGMGDTSIEHRRTETLRRFFARFGQQLPASTLAEDYLPGDIVTYDRPQNRGSRSHIALVSDVVAPSGRYMIIHNRGWGPQLEDGLFVDAITGHYRYTARAAAPLLADIPVISTPQKRPPSLTKLAYRAARRLDGMSVNGLGR